MSGAFIVWLAGTVMVFYACQFIYAWVQAEVGRLAGAAPTEVSVGFGPAVVSLQHRGVRFLFKPFPLFAYTRFRGRTGDDDLEWISDDSEPVASGKCWEDVSMPGKVLVMLVGPLSTTLFGVLFLLVPVLMQRPQLVRDPAAPADFKWSAVPGLRESGNPASWLGQVALTDQTAVEFLRYVSTFRLRSLKGCGGVFGVLVTTASAATHNWGHSLSCLGAVFVVMGLINLLPLPVLNGGQILMTCWEALIGRRLSVTIRGRLMIASVVVVLAFYFIVLLADVQWIESIRK